MSGYSGGGQYDQDEYRRRQSAGAAAAGQPPPPPPPPPPPGGAYPPPHPDYAHLPPADAAAAARSPYGYNPHGHPPPPPGGGSPYHHQSRASYGGGVRTPAGTEHDPAAMAMWSAHQREQAAHYAYGPYGATPAGAAAPPGPGITPNQRAYYGAYGGHHVPPPPPPGQDGHPPHSTPYAAAAARPDAAASSSQQQQQQQQLPYPPKSPITAKSPSKSPAGAGGGGSLIKRAPKRIKEGTTILAEDGSQQWYTGSVPLGLDDDKYWLSELQVYLRSSFAEAFGATEEDIAAPMHGRNKPIALGQVGIRCMHCKYDNPSERGQQATSYPSLISGIYNSVQQMLRLHLDCCLSMPIEVRQKIDQLKMSCSSRGGRKQYWIDSAKRLGLVDTPHGIHFGRDPHGPLPPLTGPSVNSRDGRKKKSPPKPVPEATGKPKAERKEEAEAPVHEEEELEDEEEVMAPVPQVDSRPLVFPEDKALISDYLYLTLEQMAPCNLMEADRVGCYKTRVVGFRGLACKHCVGQAGCGRYFPASEASLSQTTTSQTIMNHVRNCRRCPIEIRENLEMMKRSRTGPDGKRENKPKHGGRKVFFYRLWCRIQGLPIDANKGAAKEAKRRKAKQGGTTPKKRKQEDAVSSEEDTDTEDEVDASGDEDAKPKAKGKGGSEWFHSNVRLTKTDDPHWLSEMECFARSDLVELFTHAENDSLHGYGGRKQPGVGQVGIRCTFCKDLDPEERPIGYMLFPDSASDLQAKVADMIRLHFPCCPCMPEDVRETFKSLRGFDAKTASDDSDSYWEQAACDLGLTNIPPQNNTTIQPSAGMWGMTFRRDPLQPSPADELDFEFANDASSQETANNDILVRPEDRELCPEQMILLLRQVRPCRFKQSDRRGSAQSPRSRDRDRSMGFPGLACGFCSNRPNTMGRFFPVSAKTLTDSTINAILQHVTGCSRCPEPMKASLTYLGNRSKLQKAKLPTSWKKNYSKIIWDRLHTERKWTSVDENDEGDDDESAEEAGPGEGHGSGVARASRGGEEGAGAGEGENQMSALVAAAAIWLTEQDQTTSPQGSASKRRRHF